MSTAGKTGNNRFPPQVAVSLPTALRLFLWGNERWHFILLLLVSVTAALIETVGVASVTPFMAVLLDPSQRNDLPLVGSALRAVNITEPRPAVVALGIAVCALVALNSLVGALSTAYQAYFANKQRARVAQDLFERFLRQPYAFHAQTDSAVLTKLLFNNVDALTRIVTSILTIGSRVLVAVALVALLFYQAASVALIAVITFGGTYTLIFLLLRRWQSRIGAEASSAQTGRNRTALEALGGIKELLVLERTSLPLESFAGHSALIARTQALSAVAAAFPRNIVEPIGMGAVVFIALRLTADPTASAAAAISTLTLFAFAAFRLVPALQQSYAALMEIKYLEQMLRELYSAWIASPPPRVIEEPKQVNLAQSRPSLVVDSVPPVMEVRLVSYAHAGATNRALSDVSFSIQKGESIGVVGRSGSGKTTLLDLLLGLYAPHEGQILLDGATLTADNLREWRKRIGYVPQQVFLANATIAENVALGISKTEIDHAAVTRALSQSQSFPFVERLPDGVNTQVGERGVRLSGGQRQRLGIARALYHDPDFVFLDEATSALDSVTEDAVMGAVNGLKGSRTIVIVAHRIRTVEQCDRLIVMKQGRIVAQGSYGQLLAQSADFQELVGH